MRFKVFVINLDESTARLENISQQLSRLGLKFERVSAVRGKALSEVERRKVYDEKANFKKYYKKLNDGEIGCYMSHILCWDQIQQQQLDCALIIEDDALLTDDILHFIEYAKHTCSDWDYIALSHGRKLKQITHSEDIGHGLQVGQCKKLPSTTAGQFVSLSGANKLLQHAYPIARPVDMDIQCWYEKSLRCLVVRPFPVLHGDFGSDINEVVDRRRVKKHRLKRIWLKFHFELMLVLHHWKQGKATPFKLP